jgi:hypothetical protein
MTINCHNFKIWPFEDIEQHYTARDAILYGLGIGYGLIPLDPDERAFVYEKHLRVPPTFAVVLGYPGFWVRDPRRGIDWVRMLHSEQTLHIHKPLPSAVTVIGRSRVARIVDKGPGKGALVLIERKVADKGAASYGSGPA